MPATGPIAFATSLDPWAKELQQAVNTCSRGIQTREHAPFLTLFCPRAHFSPRSSSSRQQRPPASSGAHQPAAPPTCRYLKDSSVLRSNSSTLWCRLLTVAFSSMTSWMSVLADLVIAPKTWRSKVERGARWQGQHHEPGGEPGCCPLLKPPPTAPACCWKVTTPTQPTLDLRMSLTQPGVRSAWPAPMAGTSAPLAASPTSMSLPFCGTEVEGQGGERHGTQWGQNTTRRVCARTGCAGQAPQTRLPLGRLPRPGSPWAGRPRACVPRPLSSARSALPAVRTSPAACSSGITSAFSSSSMSRFTRRRMRGTPIRPANRQAPAAAGWEGSGGSQLGPLRGRCAGLEG